MLPIYPRVWSKTALSSNCWCGSGHCIWNTLLSKPDSIRINCKKRIFVYFLASQQSAFFLTPFPQRSFIHLLLFSSPTTLFFSPYFSQAFLLHHLSIYLGRAGSYVLGLWRDGKSASEDVPAINLRSRSALPWASSVNTLIQTEKSFHPSALSTVCLSHLCRVFCVSLLSYRPESASHHTW